MPEENQPQDSSQYEKVAPRPEERPQPNQPHFRPSTPSDHPVEEGPGNEFFRAVPLPNEPVRPVPDQPIAEDRVEEGLERPDENPSEYIQEHQLRQAAAQPGPVKGDEPVGQEATQPAPSRPSDQQPGNQIGIQGVVP